MAARGKPHSKPREHLGRVVETVGRRVRVRDDEGERVCFLSGQRAVVGDRVRWVEAKGTGGKLVSVAPRDTRLARMDARGREQILAANLGGLVVVAAAQLPRFSAGLVDRYDTACHIEGLEMVLCLNKCDLGVPPEVEASLRVRQDEGLEVLRVSAETGEGVGPLAERLAAGGPWAFVGLSGVGKTSLIAQILPEQDVGPIGEISEYWNAGRHTTTGSRLFALEGGGEIVDSPGIRGFTPAMPDALEARMHFPGVREVACQFRDCLHREGEQGCAAPVHVHPELLDSWRTLLAELTEIADQQRPGR